MNEIFFIIAGLIIGFSVLGNSTKILCGSTKNSIKSEKLSYQYLYSNNFIKK